MILQAAIERGREAGKQALYFGCWNRPGHYLRTVSNKTIWQVCPDYPGFCWSYHLMDGGLLKNGKHPDVCDGRVFWTSGGNPFWYAFFWWDRSGDSRGASNSGFYARGFGWPEAREAFSYACEQFPAIVARQKIPLVLQETKP